MKKILRFRSIFILSVMFVSIVVFAKISSKTGDFKQAQDFPRDALIYVQIQDLPAFIKLWKDSEVSQKYLESVNFAEFQKNHLALKLAERANEIYESVNIFPDLNLLAGLSENKAAAAVYDIGKMEFVFIAPMSEEKILASAFYQSTGNFEEIKLDDETLVYSKEIEVDRARQKQKILFTNFRGRFILSTSEKYFLQTLDNIKAKSPKNRLSEAPFFKQLAAQTKPNLATVWLDQNKLNEDWYFKHYWLMSGAESLKNLRAGMFDFEIQEKKLIERRIFLTLQESFNDKIKVETANRIIRLIPENVPFFKIERVEKNNFGEAVSEIFSDAEKPPETKNVGQSKEVYYFNDWGKSYSYSYLDSDFDEKINETGDDIEKNENRLDTKAATNGSDLKEIIGEANPGISLKIFSPQTLPSPLFFENRKALVFTLQNPAKLDCQKLETTLSEMAQNLLTVNNLNPDFIWKDFSTDSISARQMPLPALGWKIFYALRQNDLIFSNSEELLTDILSNAAKQSKFDKAFDKLTVIGLNDREKVFDNVFKTLQKEAYSNSPTDFFTKNIGSLLDVAANIERIEIKQYSEKNFLFEEIEFILKEKPE